MTPQLPAHRTLYTIFTGWHWHATRLCGHNTTPTDTADQARRHLQTHIEDET